jgi:hypothetical protein
VPVNEDPWEVAFALMRDHGQGGTCGMVAAGMSKADKIEEHRGWEAIANCLNAVAFNGGTRH